MKTKIIAASIAAAATLSITPAAQAKWYMNRPAAQQSAESAVVELYGDDYGVYSPTVRCRPQGNRNQGRYGSMYHRWVCGWAGEDSDGDVAMGAVLIAGTDGSYAFRYSVWRGIRWA